MYTKYIRLDIEYNLIINIFRNINIDNIFPILVVKPFEKHDAFCDEGSGIIRHKRT